MAMAEKTLTTSVSFLSGSTGNDGYLVTVPFSAFGDLAQDQFQYFEILGYKVDYQLSASLNVQFNGGSVAWYPYNYILGEAGLSYGAPVGPQQPLELPGAIDIQQGATNRGACVKPTCKQVYSVQDATVNARSAGFFTCFVTDAPVNLISGTATLYYNVRLYSRKYNNNT